jgi:ABC-type lipoprotein release transport system permease subunit
MKLLGAVINMRNVSAVNAGAFAASAALVAAAAVVATYVPARRATRIEPSQALRADA